MQKMRIIYSFRKIQIIVGAHFTYKISVRSPYNTLYRIKFEQTQTFLRTHNIHKNVQYCDELLQFE